MTIEELQIRYDELLQRARPVPGKYRLQTQRSDDGSPHVEAVGDEFHFVTTERGLELDRERYASAEELLYAAVGLDTFFLGVDFEFRNRVPDRDCRRLIFAKQIELLEAIDPDWAARKEREIAEILSGNPFVDA